MTITRAILCGVDQTTVTTKWADLEGSVGSQRPIQQSVQESPTKTNGEMRHRSLWHAHNLL